MEPIEKYLINGELPADKNEARKVRLRAARYLFVDGELHKRGFSLPLLKCLAPADANYVLREIHEGICRNHSGGRMLAYKAIREGYFWSIMHEDALELTKKCDKCQRFAKIPRQPPEDLIHLLSPWPFAQWGIDLIGPLPTRKGQVKFAIVAIDYFTKWVEAEPLATITEKKDNRLHQKKHHL